MFHYFMYGYMVAVYFLMLYMTRIQSLNSPKEGRYLT